jgi:hypothetical protein
MECYEGWPEDLPELEHLARAAVLLREQLSKTPFYRKRGERDGPDYWTKFSANCPNWLSREQCLKEFSMLSPDKQKL